MSSRRTGASASGNSAQRTQREAIRRLAPPATVATSAAVAALAQSAGSQPRHLRQNLGACNTCPCTDMYEPARQISAHGGGVLMELYVNVFDICLI